MANRVQNGTSVQGPHQSHVGFFRKMRRSLTRRGTRRSRSESPTPTGRNLVCVDIPALDPDSARSYVGHTVSRSRDLKKNCRASAVPFRPRIAPLVKTEDLEPDLPGLLYAKRNGLGPILMGKEICDDIPIPKLVKGDPQLRHCADMDENANKASQKRMSPEQEIQELILDIDRNFSEYEKQGARPKTRSVPQLYHADEIAALNLQTVTCEPVIISHKTDFVKSADDDTDDEYDDNGDLKAYCVSYMPEPESPESVTIKQDQLISEMKPKTPSEDEDDGDDDTGVYLEAHKYTESDGLDGLDGLPNGTVGKDDAIIAIAGDLLTDSSKSMSIGSDEENCKTPLGSGNNMEPLIITMATEIESYDSKTMQHASRTPHIAEVLRRHSFPDALDLKDIVLSQETKEESRKTSPGDRLSQKSISPGKEEFEEVMLLKDNQLVNHSPTSHSSMETELDACKRKSQDDIKSFCLRSSSSSSSTHSAHSIHSNHSTHSSLSSHSSHSAHGDAMDMNGGPNGIPPVVDRSTKPRYMVEASTSAADYAEGMGAEGVDAPPPLPPREQRNLDNLPDENNISRMLMNFDQNFSDDDSDTEPTHVRLEDVLGEDFFKDLKQKNEMRSRSLPRQPMRDHHSPLRKQRGGSVKNRLSSFFRMPRGRKRHSTLGFPDRPLPDVPPARGAAASRFATQPRPHSYVAANVRQPMPSPPARAPTLGKYLGI